MKRKEKQKETTSTGGHPSLCMITLSMQGNWTRVFPITVKAALSTRREKPIWSLRTGMRPLDGDRGCYRHQRASWRLDLRPNGSINGESMKPPCLSQPIIEPKGSSPGQDRRRLGSCDRTLFQICITKRYAKTGFEQPSHDQKPSHLQWTANPQIHHKCAASPQIQKSSVQSTFTQQRDSYQTLNSAKSAL
jgi:hypothetical protein